MQSTETEQEREAFAEAAEWDTSRTELLERSERRAWRVAGGAGVIAALAVGAVVLTTMRYTVEPYLYRENGETGAVDQITRLRDVDMSGDEVRDRYWIGRYLEVRETYDWNTLQADYDAVGLFSTLQVGQEYAAQFAGDGALQEKWQGSVRATVDIVSIVPEGNGIARVQFKKTTRRTNRGAEPEVTHWIATLGYRYDTSLRIKGSLRRVNPWGFQVTSYRVDPMNQGGSV